MYDNKYDKFLNNSTYQELLKHREEDNYNRKLNEAFKKFSYPNMFNFFEKKYHLYYILIILVLSIVLYITVLYILEKIKFNKKKA